MAGRGKCLLLNLTCKKLEFCSQLENYEPSEKTKHLYQSQPAEEPFRTLKLFQ